jgi:hypothetical protein
MFFYEERKLSVNLLELLTWGINLGFLLSLGHTIMEACSEWREAKTPCDVVTNILVGGSDRK